VSAHGPEDVVRVTSGDDSGLVQADCLPGSERVSASGTVFRWRLVSALITVVGAGGYIALYRLGRTSGSTRAERSRSLPGDDLIRNPCLVTNHAATLGVAPEDVWPWLTQVGWHRGGWYTPRLVDRFLFPDNWPSAERLDPALLRQLRAGDTIPDGPPGTAEFVVERAESPRLLVLHSRTHLPPGWDDRFGAALDWIWTFVLDPEDGGTRILVRNTGRVRPPWLDVAYRMMITPADYIMARGMLRGLSRRVSRASDPPPTPL